MKTLQEMFNQAYLGVIAQGGQSSDGLGHCMYRGPEGRKCAVGHLLPDESYHRRLEGKSVDYGSGALKPALIQAGIDMGDKSTKALLAKMQYIHDAPAPSDELFIERFKLAMSKLATEHGLEVPE